MRRWNGWGDDSLNLDLPPAGKEFLAERVGPGEALPDATLEAVCASGGGAGGPL